MLIAEKSKVGNMLMLMKFKCLDSSERTMFYCMMHVSDMIHMKHGVHQLLRTYQYEATNLLFSNYFLFNIQQH